MLTLGTFSKDKQSGKISGVLFGVNMLPTQLIFEPTTSAAGSEYYKVYAECRSATVEAGAAWPKISKTESAKPYLDVKLRSPGLAAPLYGKLFESEVMPDQHHFLWSEPNPAPKHEAQDSATHAAPPGDIQARMAAALYPHL
jgi:uncharacterized protein (DUF736 family)